MFDLVNRLGYGYHVELDPVAIGENKIIGIIHNTYYENEIWCYVFD